MQGEKGEQARGRWESDIGRGERRTREGEGDRGDNDRAGVGGDAGEGLDLDPIPLYPSLCSRQRHSPRRLEDGAGLAEDILDGRADGRVVY